MKRLVCLLAGLLLIAACDNAKHERPASIDDGKNQRIDINQIEKKKDVSKAQMAEELALAGEQLMTPGTIEHADMVFDKALKYDSNNARALFYKSINSPAMSMRGILKRIEPLLMKDSKKYSEFMNHIKTDAYLSTMHDFLYDGKPDIDTELKLQSFLDQQEVVYDNQRKYLKSIKDTELTLHISKALWEDVNKAKGRVCGMRVIEPFLFERACYKDNDIFKVKLERADIESLQHIASGMQVFNLVSGTYNLNGLQDLVVKYRDVNLETVTDQKLYKDASAKKGLGQMRDNKLAKIKSLGMDVISGTDWALSIQEKICGEAKGYRENLSDEPYKQFWDSPVWDYENSTYKLDEETGMVKYERHYRHRSASIRRQGYLFENGICVGDGHETLSRRLLVKNDTGEILKALELALGGNVMTIKYNNWNTESKKSFSRVKYSELLDNPVEDLLSLPKSFDYCGNLDKINNKSMNGIFVRGDAEMIGKRAGILNRVNCLEAEQEKD